MGRIVSTSCWVGLCLLSPLSYAMESLFGIDGVDGQVVLTGDSFSNLSGGLTRGTRLAGLMYTSLQLDTAKLHWWEGGKFTSSVLWIASGGPTPNMVGDYQYFDNIDTPSGVHLYEAWYQQSFLDDAFSIRAGIFDFNFEFDVLSTAAIFVNSSFGLEPDLSQNTVSTYPFTTLGLRLKYRNQAGYYVQGMVGDGAAGSPNTQHGTHFQLSAQDGEYSIIEAGFTDQPKKEDGSLDMDAPPDRKLALGSWYHTRHYVDYNGLPQDENAGLYLIGEQAFTDKLRGFFQLGVTLADRNQIANYFSVGLNYKGLLPGREDDILGLAVANARNSNGYIRSIGGAAQAETAVELTYAIKVLPNFTFQPDMQYISNPSMALGVENAFVIGARAQLTF